MANKKNVKKTSKKNTKNGKSIRKIVIATILILVTIVVMIIILINRPSKISCTKKINENGASMQSTIDIESKDGVINSVIVNKVISIKDENGQIDYMDAIKTSLENAYKEEGIKYNLEIKENELLVNLVYDKKKEYILDNLFIAVEENGVSVNVVSEDSENNYATIDLSKEYSDENIIKIIEKADYKCN